MKYYFIVKERAVKNHNIAKKVTVVIAGKKKDYNTIKTIIYFYTYKVNYI